MHIEIIGAGVAGLCAATTLREAGHEVVVYERANHLGEDASSWLAGGMLAPRCEAATAEQVVVDLGLLGKNWWSERVDVTSQGTLVLAAPRDRSELEDFARRTSHFQWQDETQMQALEPDLAERYPLGLFYREEAHLVPRRALGALKTRLENQGVRFHFGTDGPGPEVSAPHTATPETPLRIDCRGWAARDALPTLRPVKGEMLILATREVHLGRPVRLMHPRQPIYVVPHGEGRFLVGATMIDSDDRHRVTARSVAGLINSAYALHPAFGEAEIVEMGADIRPAFPDNLPRITRRGQTLFINGLYRHGFLLAPALADLALRAVGEMAEQKGADDENPREWAIA